MTEHVGAPIRPARTHWEFLGTVNVSAWETEFVGPEHAPNPALCAYLYDGATTTRVVVVEDDDTSPITRLLASIYAGADRRPRSR